MSSELKDIAKKWGLPKKAWKLGIKHRNKTFYPPHAVDSEDNCFLGKSYWNNYTDKDYNYTYNDMGFRDSIDYTPFLKENSDVKVNICLGDSATINIGDRVENSWSYQLKTLLNEPTLNLGVNFLEIDIYMNFVYKCREIFNVDKIFILHTFYELFSNPVNLLAGSHAKVDSILKLSKEQFVLHDTIFQILPHTFMYNENEKIVLKYFPNAFDFMSYFVVDWSLIDIKATLHSEVLKEKYYEISGSSWMSYEMFVQEMASNSKNIWTFFKSEYDKHLIRNYIKTYFIFLLTRNRDGFHPSKHINRAIAQYFYHNSRKI